jgi:hypothetical protein
MVDRSPGLFHCTEHQLTTFTDERDAQRKTREEVRDVKRMNDAYAEYLAQRRIERSPTMAHQFALAMRHKGETFGHSVSEIVTGLEGTLPAYWQ